MNTRSFSHVPCALTQRERWFAMLCRCGRGARWLGLYLLIHLLAAITIVLIGKVESR